mmetsp:Transcript_733/g.2357  ORF Transcript_733/g.2357 Transcript_733/m.2357 type:complete len:325 (-) Transcript_733:218-1192(-)
MMPCTVEGVMPNDPTPENTVSEAPGTLCSSLRRLSVEERAYSAATANVMWWQTAAGARKTPAPLAASRGSSLSMSCACVGAGLLGALGAACASADWGLASGLRPEGGDQGLCTMGCMQSSIIRSTMSWVYTRLVEMNELPQLSDRTASGSSCAQRQTNFWASRGDIRFPGPAKTSALTQRWPPSCLAASMSRRYRRVGSTQSKRLKSSLTPLKVCCLGTALSRSRRAPTQAANALPLIADCASSSRLRSAAKRAASSSAPLMSSASRSSTGSAPSTGSSPSGPGSSSAAVFAAWPGDRRAQWLLYRSTAWKKRSRLRSLERSVG